MTGNFTQHQDAYARVDQKLSELVEDTGVQHALLIDRTGFVRASASRAEPLKRETRESIASLVANNAAATGKLAEVLGERAFSAQVHQGENGALYIESVNGDSLLTLVIGTDVTVSSVKVSTNGALKGLAAMLEEISRMPKLAVDDDFRDKAKGLLDDLLGL